MPSILVEAYELVYASFWTATRRSFIKGKPRSNVDQLS